MNTIPKGKDNRIRTLESLMTAPPAPDPESLLSARGAILRELGRRLMTPLPELLRRGDV